MMMLFRFALYWVHRDEWIVVKPEQVVNFELKTSKTNIKYTRQLSICIIDEKIKNYEFADIQIDS